MKISENIGNEKVKNTINFSLWEKDETCSIDDRLIAHVEIVLEKGKAKECLNKITEILEEYGDEK